ncbi:hypothetical protein, partial [Staphylococcus aureus]|uniref:hypothetical protein n=1 Tax=Staphylococcus aureus TaxID=1280 RepID=UPI001CC9FBB9
MKATTFPKKFSITIAPLKLKISTTNIKILNIATKPNVIINLLHKEINYLCKGGGITCLLLK